MSNISGRAFLVGCPRSGTTFLQSLIASHPQIASFPETHFFRALGGNRFRAALGIASPTGRERKQLARFLATIQRPDLIGRIPRWHIRSKPYAMALFDILDTLTIEEQATHWLEKTPDHLHYISIIDRLLPSAHFIHTIRCGEDTVASLYQVLQTYPDTWGGTADLDWCINRWNQDIRLSASQIGKVNHKFVRYDHLLEEPENILIQLCDFLGVPFDRQTLQASKAVIDKIVLPAENWKDEISRALGENRPRKFEALLTPKEQDDVKQRLSPLEDLFSGIL